MKELPPLFFTAINYFYQLHLTYFEPGSIYDSDQTGAPLAHIDLGKLC